MKVRLVLLAAALLLSACTAKHPAADLSDPAALYSAMTEVTELGDMFALTDEDLLYMIGVDPQWYTSCAAYMASEGTSPEEILIFRAADAASAERILETLENRLQYKRACAAQYLVENQSLLRDGVVRADGLTVSLIVTEDIEAVHSVYP